MTPPYAFAFCEPPDAIGGRPMCIRRLSGLGLKLRGPIDTPSLCRRVKPTSEGGTGGHDFSLPVDVEGVVNGRVCERCLTAYREVLGV